MNAINLRERRQITLPSDIVVAAGLQTNDVLDVRYANGVIQLVPRKALKNVTDMRRFLGCAAGMYGTDTASMNDYVRAERDAW